MKDLPLTSIQIMMSSDELAYDLGLIPTPKKIEKNKINGYMLIGGFTVFTIGLISYCFYQIHQEYKRKKLN